MKVCNKIPWPPLDGGAYKPTAKMPQSESQSIIREVRVEEANIVLIADFKANSATFDVATRDCAFAKKLAEEFSKHIGDTLQRLGDLDINF